MSYSYFHGGSTHFASAPAITTEPDWSQVQVDKYPDSSWLHKPPTEKALQEHFPDLVFRSSEVRDSAAFAADVRKRPLFGHPPDVKPIKPGPDEYIFDPSELSPAPAPTVLELKPPDPLLDSPPPPGKFLYPQAPTFTLRKTNAYQCGYAYTAPYHLSQKDADYARMMHVVLPPQLSPRLANGKYEHAPVPNCVQMVPGVPFAFEIDGDPDELHTIGAVHTFESLRHEPEFWDIYKQTVLVAKGLRGCRPAGNTDEVFPISDHPLKPNDRSPSDLPPGSKEGSFNLASTLLKGIGQGVVLPAAQVDTPPVRGQLSTVLQSLSRYGGLEPNNGTSCQGNFSGIWMSIAKALGISGTLHPDPGDEDTRKTHVISFFDLPPDSDPGAFLLARSGLYLRELNTWAVHIVFDGTGIHGGTGTETALSKEEFLKWVETELETAWKHSYLSQIVVVQYAMKTAHNRNTHMSMTPSIRFGNIGPELPTGLRDFATHGQDILGGQEPWANRMGREIVFGFWHQLQLCNLDLGIDIDDLMQRIMFQNSTGDQVHLKPLPFHPVRDTEIIAQKRGHFEYLRQRYLKMRIFIEKWRFVQFRKALASDPHNSTEVPNHGFIQWPSRSSISTAPQQNPTALFNTSFEGQVVKILDRIRVGNECCFRVMTDDVEAAPRLIHQNDARLPVQMVEKFLASEVRKITLAPILETCGMDSTNEDITMIDAGPSETSRKIDHSIRAHVDDTTGVGQPELAHADSAGPENQDINTAGESDTASAHNNNTGLGCNIGDSSNRVFHAVSDAEHLGTTTIPPQADDHTSSSDSNSRPEPDSSNPAPNSLETDLNDEPEYEVEKIVDVAHNAAASIIFSVAS
ncbi:hypothetical protein C8R45DRAFT_1181159 [Mycena sanguinolenta]|nr:hypothetical protein C8R45DRAFT_1181159 [Mycena sanguinolenta]